MKVWLFLLYFVICLEIMPVDAAWADELAALSQASSVAINNFNDELGALTPVCSDEEDDNHAPTGMELACASPSPLPGNARPPGDVNASAAAESLVAYADTQLVLTSQFR